MLVAPAYFAGKMQLGGMMQTASAFGSVQDALSFFVTTYRTLAEWRAVSRVSTASRCRSQRARRRRRTPTEIDVARDDGKRRIDIEHLLGAAAERRAAGRSRRLHASQRASGC